MIQADTPLETPDPLINCSPSVIATITVIQGLLVKLQVYRLMSGSLCAIWDPTKKLSHKQEFSCLSDFELCVIFLKVIHSLNMRCNQHCERRKGTYGMGIWRALFRLCTGIFCTTLCFSAPGEGRTLA